MRTLFGLFGILATATLLSQGVGLGLLYFRGQLTPETVTVIGQALRGEVIDPTVAAPPPPAEPTLQNVLEERTLRVLRLRTREEELTALKDLLSQRAEEFEARQKQFAAEREAFREELTRIAEQNQNEATERARGIVAASKTDAAVTYLMGLSAEENVRILLGLPAKTQAKILQEFADGSDEQSERGQVVFAALAQGEPEAGLVGQAAEAVDEGI